MEDVDSPRASGVNLDSRWVIQSQNSSLTSLVNTQKPLPRCWVLREYLWKELMQIIGESKQASLPKKEGMWLYIKGWDMNKAFLFKKNQKFLN